MFRPHRTTFRRVLAILTSPRTVWRTAGGRECSSQGVASTTSSTILWEYFLENISTGAAQPRALSKSSWKSLTGGLGPNPLFIHRHKESSSFYSVSALNTPSYLYNLPNSLLVCSAPHAKVLLPKTGALHLKPHEVTFPEREI